MIFARLPARPSLVFGRDTEHPAAGELGRYSSAAPPLRYPGVQDKVGNEGILPAIKIQIFSVNFL